jgi:hypothetical protein
MKPSVSVKRLIRLMEQWRLGTEEVLITGRRRFLSASGLVMILAHLSLHKLVEEFSLSGQNLGQIWRGWWRLLGTAGLICPKTFRGSASSSNNLKQRSYPLSIKSLLLISDDTQLPKCISYAPFNRLISDVRILRKMLKHEVWISTQTLVVLTSYIRAL